MENDSLGRIDERVEEISLQISRLDERIDTFKLNEKISRLSAQLYFLLIVAVAGGLSGSYLFLKFKEAQGQVSELEERLDLAQEKIDAKVDEARDGLDKYIEKWPGLEKYDQMVADFKIMTTSTNEAGRARLYRTPDCSTRGDWHKPVMVPPGFYIAGIGVKHEGKQGLGDDTGLNAIELYCLPFKRE